ncbi:Peroxiredoxin-1 [Mycoemilia scoparia]|uniref:Peroxiredoxin-1 n=1 Tax=Mycoemilia scoparia TaxID=417184 RepID=A0A9W7ZP01_9FUNG|nr:Peroxiredoxin-1 [Mycoemilia scoparia]
MAPNKRPLEDTASPGRAKRHAIPSLKTDAASPKACENGSSSDTTAPVAEKCEFIGRPGRIVPDDIRLPMLLENGEFSTKLTKELRGKYWILVFYPADFTFVCPTELLALSDRIDEFNELSCTVLGCSVDSEYAHHAWTQQPRNQGGISGIKIPLVSDRTHTISRLFSVLDEETGMAFRSLFIIDPQMKIRVANINDNPLGRSVDEILRLLKAVQFSDKHGEVCPANWRPGDATIVPEVSKSKQYFSQNA